VTAYEAQLRERLLQSGSIALPQRIVVPTLNEFGERWLRDYVAVNNRPIALRTRASLMRARILPEFGHSRLDDIRADDVEHFKACLLRDNLRPKTINNILGALRSCLLVAREWEVIAKVPRIRLLTLGPSTTNFLSVDNARKLVDAAEPGQWRTMVIVALATGLRVGELLALTWNNIDLNRSELTVAWTEVDGLVTPPKNGQTRVVPLTREATEALRELDRDEGRVFLIPPMRYPYRHAFRRLDQIGKRAGVRARWHLLRHSFASHMVSHGAPLVAVRECLGHTTIQMTLRYAHFAPDALRRSIAVLPELRRLGHPVGTLPDKMTISPLSSSESSTENLAKNTQESRLEGVIQ
jgi:integrase